MFITKVFFFFFDIFFVPGKGSLMEIEEHTNSLTTNGASFVVDGSLSAAMFVFHDVFRKFSWVFLP
jgi:hypothetical protein